MLSSIAEEVLLARYKTSSSIDYFKKDMIHTSFPFQNHYRKRRIIGSRLSTTVTSDDTDTVVRSAARDHLHELFEHSSTSGMKYTTHLSLLDKLPRVSKSALKSSYRQAVCLLATRMTDSR